VDVRPSVTDVAAASDGTADLLAAKLGWLGASPKNVLIFGVKVSALGSARPVEVVEAFTDPTVAREAPIARLGLWAAPAKSAGEEEGGAQEKGAAFVDPLQLSCVANAANSE
jgi:hypothetical protein